MTPALLRLLFKGRSVCFVAPTPVLEGAGMGAEIDSFDIVMRSNMFPVGNAADHGSRCDIISVLSDNIKYNYWRRVPVVIHYFRYDFGMPTVFVGKKMTKEIKKFCRQYTNTDVIQPTAGMVAWWLANKYGASRIKMFGCTGYQNDNNQVANHTDQKHYSDEYIDTLNFRDRANEANMVNYEYHNFAAQNDIWRKLIKEGKMETDNLTAKYFT